MKFFHPIQKLVFLVLILMQGAVFAASEYLGSVDAMKDQSQQTSAEELFAKKKNILPQAEIDKEIKKEVEAAEKGEKEEPKFVLKSLSITGNTIVETKDLEEFWKDLMGKEIGFSDLKKVSRKITILYRKKGYFLSYALVPTQKVIDGKVNLRMIEGYVDKAAVAFEEQTQTPSERLKTLIAHLQGERPMKQATYERYILLIRDLYPHARGYLEPSKEHGDGATTLRIVIPKESHIHGNVEVNNYTADSVGPWMGSASIDFPSPLNQEHRIATRYAQGTYMSELTMGGVQYTLPVGFEGATLDVGMEATKGSPQGDIAFMNMKSKSQEYDASFKYPYIRSQDLDVHVGAQFSIENQRRYIGFGNTVYKERSRKFGLFTSVRWDDDIGGRTFANVAFMQGLNVFNAVNESSAHKTRNRGAGKRFYMQTKFNRMQKIAGQFFLGVYLDGQYATASLLGIDRFRSSGLPFSGAYPTGTLSGDSGLEGKLELNYIHRLENIGDLRFFAYLSKVKIWNRNPNSNEQSAESLKGGGFGCELKTKKNLSFALQYGTPFDKPSDGNSINPHMGAKVGYRF